MKKLLMMVIVLLASGALLAQGSKVGGDSKFFLALHGGPSFPVGDFSKKDMAANENSGYAKTGYTINLTGAYQVQKNFGFAADFFYNRYKANKVISTFDVIDEVVDGESGLTSIEVPLTLNHWQHYGVAAGPMLTFNVVKNVDADVRIMGGVANANSPKIIYDNVVMAKEDWAIAPVFKSGIDLRIGTGGNLFVLLNADYLYLKPHFKYTYTNENEQEVTEKVKQRMEAINVTAGIGYRF